MDSVTILLKDLKNQGKKIVGYAAASKGTIVQNYCNINNNTINYIADTTQKSDLIPGVEIKKMNVFANDQGYLFETIRSDDKMYDGKFGQVLVSELYPGVIKGLHLHNNQTEYTTCLKGNIKYVAIKETPNGPIINTFIIGEKNPIIVKVPPGVWHGYTSLENKSATLMYLMDRPFNIEDSGTEEKDVFAFGDIWKVKHG